MTMKLKYIRQTYDLTESDKQLESVVCFNISFCNKTLKLRIHLRSLCISPCVSSLHHLLTLFPLVPWLWFRSTQPPLSSRSPHTHPRNHLKSFTQYPDTVNLRRHHSKLPLNLRAWLNPPLTPAHDCSAFVYSAHLHSQSSWLSHLQWWMIHCCFWKMKVSPWYWPTCDSEFLPCLWGPVPLAWGSLRSRSA